MLLLLFLLNPGGLGQRIGLHPLSQHISGFRSVRRSHMTVASLLYLLPLSILGILVLSVDGMILGVSL